MIKKSVVINLIYIKLFIKLRMKHGTARIDDYPVVLSYSLVSLLKFSS